MAIWDAVAAFFALRPMQEELQVREATLEDLLARASGQALRTSPWRMASIREALGVPAIYRAVSLIANTVGALSLEAYRQGVKLDNEERPRIIVRPDPFRTPRDFLRDTAWNMASRGEAWWWIAARDADRNALSVLNINPAEIQVTVNERDLRFPRIEWRGQRMRNEDMRHLTLNMEPGQLRGQGPLQFCGAATSVAVEAQEWAANFYAEGGTPSIVIKSAVPLEKEEAELLKEQWTAGDNHVPKVIDPGIEDVEDFNIDPVSAAMLSGRDFQNAEAGRMFGIPASLLDVPIGGSSLTYQNLEQEFGKFVRACLWPNYLEPIEQTMSDLLTRQTVSRFNVDALLRPDAKTRYEIYKLGVTDSGVLEREEARQMEGLDAGDVENAAMPLSVPQAIPSLLPIQGRSQAGPIRCPSCGKTRFVVESLEPPRLRCIRCRGLAA